METTNSDNITSSTRGVGNTQTNVIINNNNNNIRNSNESNDNNNNNNNVKTISQWTANASYYPHCLGNCPCQHSQQNRDAKSRALSDERNDAMERRYISGKNFLSWSYPMQSVPMAMRAGSRLTVVLDDQVFHEMCGAEGNRNKLNNVVLTHCLQVFYT
ncbi:hypothetical protein PoB_004205400 [Plakobranchus ocellatus]|uniref:Uncharacterized protein n=1 Tax=Plakobranchus ocellatus TaxID=259542 RepID=A0AAV4BA06_9GAST|nr:hypothetical protein PoB_004205400 [Plakobranchus ocellatus]